MMQSTSAASWMMAKAIFLGVPLILLLLVNNSFAAPANSNEDQIGFVSASRQAFRNHENNPQLVDFNSVPVVSETGIPLEQPVDIGIILSYLARHLGANNGARYISNFDRNNDQARKRSSYSRYCAFNAVSCFGRKK